MTLYLVQCFGSVSFLSVSGSDLKSKKYLLFSTFFFYLKYISSKNYLFCHLWGKYSCPFNLSLIFVKKCMIFLWFWFIFVESFHDFRWFFATRTRIRIRNTDYVIAARDLDPNPQPFINCLSKDPFRLPGPSFYPVGEYNLYIIHNIFITVLKCISNFFYSALYSLHV